MPCFLLFLSPGAAVQAVEPRAALFYWDYTIDSVRCGADLGCLQTTSKIFTDDFLGASFPKKTADARFAVIDSVFAGAPMPRASGGDAGEGVWPEHNVFGMLSDSYDFNNATTLTRAIGEWCGSEPAFIGEQMAWLTSPCGIIDDTKAQTNLADFYNEVSNAFHGGAQSVHAAFGGATHCAATFDELRAVDEEYYETYGGLLAASLNGIWATLAGNRALTVPHAEQCTHEGTHSKGIPACMSSALPVLGLDVDKLDGKNLYHALNDTMNLVEFPAEMYGIFPETDTETLRVLTRIICYVGALTPMATPYASVADPLFFTIHSLYDRIWAEVQLSQPGFNKTWTGGEIDQSFTCVGHALDHPVMDFNMPIGPHTPAGQYDAGEICAGFPEDPLCNSGYYETRKAWTNAELIELFEPSRAELPYMYDHFMYPACAAVESIAAEADDDDAPPPP